MVSPWRPSLRKAVRRFLPLDPPPRDSDDTRRALMAGGFRPDFGASRTDAPPSANGDRRHPERYDTRCHAHAGL